MNVMRWARVAFLATVVFGVGYGVEAQEAKTSRRPIEAADYGDWERLGRSTLSPDGRWLAVEVRTIEGAYALRLHMLATDSTESFEFGSGARFSADGKWLAYTIGVHPDKARKAKKPLRRKLGIHDLVTGKAVEIDAVQSFRFHDRGTHLIFQRYGSGSESGNDWVVRNLETGTDTVFGNIRSCAFNDDGDLLALLVDTKDDTGNGIQIYDVREETLRALVSSDHTYARMTWREDSTDLAVTRSPKQEKSKKGRNADEASLEVLAWTGLGDGHRKLRRFTAEDRDDFPENHRVVGSGGLRWSDDGRYLYFGIRKNDPKPEVDSEPEAEDEKRDSGEKPPTGERLSDDVAFAEDAEPVAKDSGKSKESEKKKRTTLRESLDDPAGVEVWHHKDIDIQPRQKRIAGRERNASHLSAWRLEDDLFRQLEDDSLADVLVVDSSDRAVGYDNLPYETEKRFGPTLHDIYRVDVPTGQRAKFLERVKYFYMPGPGGRFAPFIRNDEFHLLDLTTGEVRPVTEGVEVDFTQVDASQLTDEKPPFGRPTWSDDGRYLYLNDEFDVWEFPVEEGEPRRLTRGREEQIRHRLVQLDPEAEGWNREEPVYLSLYGEWTKKSGYARMDWDGRPEVLVWDDASVRGLRKADDASVFAFSTSKFDEPPTLHTAGSDLSSPRAVCRSNSQHADFAWGRAELVDYESENGDRLQGALFYPAGYEPGRKYPMVTYIYEKRSQTLHSYPVPSETSAYNPAVWTSQGYFVYQPDIVYRAQNPGLSAVECLVPAVRAVLERGEVDPERVALVGHSWGAYQTAFVVTQTDMFAAGIAGAPLTNMMSMSMSIYWNSGQTDAWIFHESQGRMDRPFWNDVETYIKNSPIFSIESLRTPLLVAFGTEDGAVDFNQGVELYNAARLAQRPLVMLVYPGENHGLAKRPNQVDYHYRILEWLGHYLKDEPAKSWITEGQPFLDREKEIEAQKAAKKKSPR